MAGKNYIQKAKKRIVEWFSLGLGEGEIANKDMLSEYKMLLAKDNIEAMPAYCKISYIVLGFMLITRVIMNGVSYVNIVPYLCALIGIIAIDIFLNTYSIKTGYVKMSYTVLALYGIIWYALCFYFDVIIHSDRANTMTCLVFMLLTSLFKLYPRDNIIAALVMYGAMTVLELYHTPQDIFYLNSVDVMAALIIGVAIGQKNTSASLSKKIYTDMYKAATKTSILVAQIDMFGDTFRILRSPEYMVKLLSEIVGVRDGIKRIAEQFIYENHRDDFLKFMDISTISERLGDDEQLAFYFQDIYRKWYLLNIVVHKKTRGRISSVIVIAYDIDETKKQEIIYQQRLHYALIQAEEANSAKTGFLSRMSHDIRTPLNGIIGLLKIDDKHPDDKELLTKNRAKMLVSANHLLELINDVLQMSKLESGDIVLSKELINLEDISKNVLDIIEQRSADAGVTLEYDKESDKIRFPYVYGSPLHIRQIFLNIYGNCIKYNRVGGKIRTKFIELKNDGKTVIYKWIISDTGIGMSKEFLKHIFEPFVQEHIDARSVYHGTGLGMSIVKGLLDKMDGTIDVASEVGKGTTFVVTIPFEISDRIYESSNEDNSNILSVRGLNVLVAEDNELNAEIAEALLNDEGINTTIVHDGKQAVECFEKNPVCAFDAVLMDIMMPNMDGITATKEIRKMDRDDAEKIPIIALTANAFDEDSKRCLDAGMNAHISKPFQINK